MSVAGAARNLPTTTMTAPQDERAIVIRGFLVREFARLAPTS
jgi:hypothetical protein